jgi:hypothetical protein
MAEWRLLQAMLSAAGLRILCRRQLNHNLPAGVPKGRFFCSSSASLFGGFVPSFLVPDDEVAGRDWKLQRKLGGDGLDCFSHLWCRVLFVKEVDLAAALLFLKVLFVICTTPININALLGPWTLLGSKKIKKETLEACISSNGINGAG